MMKSASLERFLELGALNEWLLIANSKTSWGSICKNKWSYWQYCLSDPTHAPKELFLCRKLVQIYFRLSPEDLSLLKKGCLEN